jgi:putative transposase
MARPARDSAAGVFHVTAHSVWSAELFRDDLDRHSFIEQLAQTAERHEWICIGLCLLTTHYHLLLDVNDATLPDGMQELNFRHATRFNGRHGLRGHVFAGRYGAQRIDSDGHLLVAFRYLARNPIEARLAETPAAWRWSNYASTIGLDDAFSFVDASRVIGCFGPPGRAAVVRLRRFVESPW